MKNNKENEFKNAYQSILRNDKYYKVDNSGKLVNFVENMKNGTTDINKLSGIFSIFT